MKLNIKCPINSLGYGRTGFNVIKALLGLNVDIAHFPIGQTTIEVQADFEIVQRVKNNQAFFDHHAPCLKICHQFDMTEWIGRNKLYGFPIFESDTFNKHEIHHLNYCDGIIVASNWAKTIVQNHLPSKECFVAPLGVDREIFKQRNKSSDSNITRHSG